MRTFLLLVSLFWVFDSSQCDLSPDSFDQAEFLKPIAPPIWDTIPKWPLVKELFPYPLQSPVNIITSEATEIDLPRLWIHFPWNSNKEMVSIENTGYYLEVLLPHEITERPYITGGPLNEGSRYVFEQLHFHWGSTDECGSENRIDNQCHSTEVHLVFYNIVYTTFKESQNHADGVAVLTLFGDISAADNPDFEHLIHEFSKVVEPESKTKGSFDKEFKFLEILKKQDTYYTFPGSLTTEPFSECVTWIVFPKPYKISSKQLQAFRNLKGKDGHNLNCNDREIQNFYGRPLVRPPKNKKRNEIFKFAEDVLHSRPF